LLTEIYRGYDVKKKVLRLFKTNKNTFNNSEGKKPLGRPRRRLEDNIKLDLYVDCQVVD